MADIVTLRFGVKSHTTINRQDQIKLIGKLFLCYMYAYTGPPNKRVSVHSVVMGPRPDNVPEDWVIDHIDRDRFNNTRENLRWVSPSFNAFNAKRPDSGVSRFRGVHFCPEQANRFRAKGAGGVHIGNFSSEREAAIASATFYVRKYGKWAETSDLLFTRDQSSPGALLSLKELADIKRTIAQEALLPAPMITTKSTGVDKTRSGLFRARYGTQYLGVFKTFEAALAVREEHVKALRESEWKAHESLTITYDSDGDAVIVLEDGKWGSGVKSKVDAELWHRLTFKTTWFLDRIGYATSWSRPLHMAVMMLIDSDYVPNRNTSIDHKDPAAKLDNRRSNLRVATHAEQQRNKVPYVGKTSIHKGVNAVKNGWIGRFSYTSSDGPQTFYVPRRKTEKEVVLLLNEKRTEVHGITAALDHTFSALARECTPECATST
jgi:hypothetical protein